MNNKFILINKERQFYVYLDKFFFSSFPKNEWFLKDRIYKDLFNLIENTMAYNMTKGNIKAKHLTNCKIYISMIDFIINTILEKELVKKRRVLSAINMLNEIKKIVYSLESNETKE